MSIKIVPYKTGSRSAAALAQALNVRQVRREPARSRYRPRQEDILINWGCTNESFPAHLHNRSRVLNTIDSVTNACNKLEAFQIMAEHDVSIPDFTTDLDLACEWAEEGLVVSRTLLRANGGRGIAVGTHMDEPPTEVRGYVTPAPLYVKYVPKRFEYRIHLMRNIGPDGGYEVIDKQRKARNLEVADENVDWRIRNHDNGFIFARNEDHDIPDCVIIEAFKAMSALNLDFGAVDVIYNERRDQAYVLEVNTACGLEGETVNSYRDGFTRLIEQIQEQRAAA